jgi:hypothetical protein
MVNKLAGKLNLTNDRCCRRLLTSGFDIKHHKSCNRFWANGKEVVN